MMLSGDKVRTSFRGTARSAGSSSAGLQEGTSTRLRLSLPANHASTLGAPDACGVQPACDNIRKTYKRGLIEMRESANDFEHIQVPSVIGRRSREGNCRDELIHM